MTTVALQTFGTLFQDNYYTNDPTLVFDDLAPGATRDIKIFRDGVQVFPASGATIESVFLDADGNPIEATFTVELTDTIAGIPGPTFFLAFVVDTTAPSAPTVTLANDTGTAGDLVTSDATLGVTLEPNATARYAIQPAGGGALVWFTSFDGDTGLYAALANREGLVTIIVEQIDLAGNATRKNITFTLDHIAPELVATLTDNGQDFAAQATGHDTLTFSYRLQGTAGDFITLPSDSMPADIEPGTYEVKIVATDLAGNTTTETVAVVIPEPTATLLPPTVALNADTGTSTTDGITNNGAINVTGIGEGNRAQFSYDGGTTWLDAQRTDLADGTYSVLVRQANDANEFSNPVTVAFTLDTVIGDLTAPAEVDLDVWEALGGFVTTFQGQEAGAIVWYKLNDGAFATDRPVDGLKAGDVISIYQVDLAGNQSATETFTITNETDPVDPPVEGELTSGGTGGLSIQPPSDNYGMW